MTMEQILTLREKTTKMAATYRERCSDPEADPSYHLLFAIWTSNVILAEILWEQHSACNR